MASVLIGGYDSGYGTSEISSNHKGFTHRPMGGAVRAELLLPSSSLNNRTVLKQHLKPCTGNSAQQKAALPQIVGAIPRPSTVNSKINKS